MTYFSPAPLEMVAMTTSRIYLMINLIDITRLVMANFAIKLAKNLNFCASWLVMKHRKGRSKL